MTTESASERQQQWILVVRRSFGISDQLPYEDAREALIGNLEDQLLQTGWQRPTRGICEPMVDALLALESTEDRDDPDDRDDANDPDDRGAAHRLLGNGIATVDPEQLVFDARFEYPSEIVAVAQQALDRVGRYVREQPETWLPS